MMTELMSWIPELLLALVSTYCAGKAVPLGRTREVEELMSLRLIERWKKREAEEWMERDGPPAERVS